MKALDRPVSELMEREVVTLQREDRLDLAGDVMRLGRIRHMPVLQGSQLVGIVSNRDLLAASLSSAFEIEQSNRREFQRSVEVKEVMTQDVDTVGPDDRADEAGRRMLRRQIGCLPVVDARGHLLGLLTESDLLAAALGVGSRGEDAATGTAQAHAFEAELEQLQRVRDELRLQLHLGKAEATELWEKLEHRLAEAETRVKTLATRAEEPVQDVTDAARHLMDEIRGGYRKLRDLL